MLRLLDHDPVPSLVHGDLWAGNVVDGRWLIDPAVHHADREVELAYMDLFGRLPRPMWDAYLDAWPLAEGGEQRRPALQLYNLLVHVAIFGRRYVEPIVSRLDDLGW
jgi:fructosamine-3-kinase